MGVGVNIISLVEQTTSSMNLWVNIFSLVELTTNHIEKDFGVILLFGI